MLFFSSSISMFEFLHMKEFIINFYLIHQLKGLNLFLLNCNFFLKLI